MRMRIVRDGDEKGRIWLVTGDFVLRHGVRKHWVCGSLPDGGEIGGMMPLTSGDFFRYMERGTARSARLVVGDELSDGNYITKAVPRQNGSGNNGHKSRKDKEKTK